MTTTIYDQVSPVIERAVLAAARRWPGVSPDDLRGAAWVKACEALASFDRTRASAEGQKEGTDLARYVGTCVRRALDSEARRIISPVRLPKTREFEVPLGSVRRVADPQTTIALTAENTRGVDEKLDQARLYNRLHTAVRDATQRHPELREVLLGEKSATDLAANGGHPSTWKRRVVRAKEEIRKDMIR